MEGTQLSTYRIVSELGSGGMGKVYRAEVAEQAVGLQPGAAVALKVIHPHLLDTPGFFKRFLREAHIGQQVQHDNVVRTWECDATLQDGVQQNFLVMEFVEGQTLRDLLRELERVPEELCRHVGCEMAKGLAAIHEVGVVHRDIKPENVLITEEHVVKVMDLGVARLQDEVIRLSQAGAFVGSLEYAAPEQFMSGGEEADERADLHALGLVLYELATGQHPYRDEDAKKVLRNVLDVSPRRAGEVNPQLSPFFEEVVHQLLAKKREDRFATAAEIADVLDVGEASAWWTERAKALRVETKKPLRRIRVPRETALYGRDDDLAKLHVLFDKAKAGDGQALLVEGEAGIGKTRLVDEFVGRLRQEGEDINFLFGSYPPGGAATASGAFSTAYREQFGDVALEETLVEYLTPTPVLIPAFAALLRGETSPKDAEALTKDSLQTVFVHATRALAEERPTIVLIDDLHFAPDDGRSLFAALALAAPGRRILLIGTSRPGISEDWATNLERTGHFSRLGLSRLGPKDLLHLLRDSFRSERLANELAGQIAIKSDGNPFFAFEIVQGLREGQYITQSVDGTWISTQVIEDIQIPSSVMDLINARISDLEGDERNLLDVASCCGFEFDPLLAGSVLGLAAIPALQLLGRVEKAHRLVRAKGRRFAFDHHQVQEVLYAGLSELLREAYHAALAEGLEMREQAADQDPDHLDGALCLELCEHYLKGACGAQALRYLEAAQRHLTSGYLHGQVVSLIERALAVPDLLTGIERARALLRLAEALAPLGRPQREEACVREAEHLADEARDDDLRGQAVKALARFLRSAYRHEEAERAGRRELELALARGDRRAEADATVSLGGAFRTAGRLPDAREQLQCALATCREIGYRQGEANAKGLLALVLWDEGRLREAREQLESGLAISHEIGDRQSEVTTASNLAIVLWNEGRLQEARERYEACIALNRVIGNRVGEANNIGNLGIVFLSEGRLQEAREHLERCLVLSRELGRRVLEANTLGNLGGVAFSEGRLRESRELQAQSLTLSREIGHREAEARALVHLGTVVIHEGDTERGQEHLVAGLTLANEIGQTHLAAVMHLQLGALHAAAGNGEAGRASLTAARDLAAESGLPNEETLAQCHLACMPGADAQVAIAVFHDNDERLDTPDRCEARWLLWRATGDRTHLDEAKRLLDDALLKVPEEYHESMLTNVRVNREIMRAWNERATS